MSDRKEEAYSEEETARRRDEALRRALTMPPKPKGGKAVKGGAKAAGASRRVRAPSKVK